MMGTKKLLLLLLPLVYGLGILYKLQAQLPDTTTPYNVLFIAIDDLRPQLGCYGQSIMHTPHLDKLAEKGRLFNRHYVQVPTCGASRYALLTGRRPYLPAHLSNQAFRDLTSRTESEQPESFAHVFRRNGYKTASLGKISHYPDGKLFTYEGEGEGEWEMPFSWDKIWGPVGKWGTSWNAFFGYSNGENRNMQRGHYPAFERAAVPDTALPDGLTAEAAIQQLREWKDEPFLISVGFFKPHLPFTAPDRYWQLYDDLEIPLSPNPDAPMYVHPQSLNRNGEMFGNYKHEHKGGPGVRLPDDYARTLRQAYFAAVSYVDAQVGKVLDELEKLGWQKKPLSLSGGIMAGIWEIIPNGANIRLSNGHSGVPSLSRHQI